MRIAISTKVQPENHRENHREGARSMSSRNKSAYLLVARRLVLALIIMGAGVVAVLFVQQAKGLPFQSPYPPAKATIIARSNRNKPGAPHASKTSGSALPTIPGVFLLMIRRPPRTGI